MKAIAAIMAAFSGVQAQHALGQLDPYESRGKGKSKGFIGSGRPGARKANMRAAHKARNVRRHRAAMKG